MEESHRKVLKKLRLKISRNINVRRVTEKLFSEGILDENDREVIYAETTTEYKALRLLDLLPRKGSHAFPVLMQALRDSGSGSGLANAIQSELSGKRELFDFEYVDQVRHRVFDMTPLPKRELGNVLIIHRLPVIGKVIKNAYVLLLFRSLGLKEVK